MQTWCGNPGIGKANQCGSVWPGPTGWHYGECKIQHILELDLCKRLSSGFFSLCRLTFHHSFIYLSLSFMSEILIHWSLTQLKISCTYLLLWLTGNHYGFLFIFTRHNIYDQNKSHAQLHVPDLTPVSDDGKASAILMWQVFTGLHMEDWMYWMYWMYCLVVGFQAIIYV